MNARKFVRRVLPVVFVAILSAATVPAEVVEEIVAWVDGDIITKSEFEKEEREAIQEIFSRYTGDEVDRRVRQTQDELLLQMIDRKIMMHRAERVFDIEAVGDSYLNMFKRQQKIDDDEELVKVLEQGGFTVEEFRQRMLERFVPDEVLRIEVDNRVSVGEQEVEDYYRDNPNEFGIVEQITLREIVLLAEEDDRERRRAEAEEIRLRAAAPGADFAALATELSEAGTASAGGLLGPLKRGEMAEELELTAFTLPIGDISPIVEMPHSLHILRVESRTDPGLEPLETVRDGLRQKLENRKYLAALQAFLQRAREEADWKVNDKYKDRLPEATN